MQSIAIIGSGLSGLTCGRTLFRNKPDLKIQLLDKHRHPGGRLASRFSDEFHYDTGAQYFTVNCDEFEVEVQAMQNQGYAEEWLGEMRVLDRGKVSETSGRTKRYVGVGSQLALAEYVGKEVGEMIDCNVRVVKVQKGKNGWVLYAEGGLLVGQYDAVVIAVPAPQAVDLLQEGEIQDRVGEVEMAPCIALFGKFPTSLRDEFGFDGAFVNNSPIRWMCRNNSKPGRPILDNVDCWMIHATPEWSQENYDKDPEELKELLLSELSLALYNEEKPLSTEGLKIKKWKYAIPTKELGDPFIWDNAQQLGLCGDWCSNSKIESAYLSGKHLAEEILKQFD